jgi:hypothetical protein
MEKRHRTVREGVTAGVLGATLVAVWFFIVDTLAMHPFHTPRVLGAALFSLLGPAGSESPALYVGTYTIVHYALFIAAGLIATAMVHAAHREPTILAGAFILFVIFELAFYSFVSLLAHTLLEELAWYSVAIGNALAAVAMGTYLWLRHPALAENFSYSLSGKERKEKREKHSNRPLPFRKQRALPIRSQAKRRRAGP